MRSPRPGLMAALLAFLALLVSACSSTEQRAPTSAPPGGPAVVASTSWVGAFAKAAGARSITLVAPASVPHPPDYDPKPSDLAKVSSADYVLYTPFDSFATRMTDAAGGRAKKVELNLDNTPATIHREVTRLGQLFGTSAQAGQWLAAFDQRYAELSAQVKAAQVKAAQVKVAQPQPAPSAVAQKFMAYWGDFAGLRVAGTYGPEPITPGQLAQLTALHPALVLDNAHQPSDPGIPGARTIELINFPGADLDLLEVFQVNAQRLSATERPH